MVHSSMLTNGAQDDYSDASGSGEYKPPRPAPVHGAAQPPTYAPQPTSGNGRIAQPLSEKRKMQNRAAQKSFRERRDRYLKDLEEKVANQAELDAQTSARIRNLEAENAALRRLLSQSILPPGSQPLPPASNPAHANSLWPDSALLDAGRPASATSSEVNRLLGGNEAEDLRPSISALSAGGHLGVGGMGMPAAYSGDSSSSHYSILEDVDVIDWRFAWAQLCSHPLYPECDRDALWQDLRKKARYCVDRPPVIGAEELERLKHSISQRARPAHSQMDR